MVSHYLWGQEGFWRGGESKSLLSKSSLDKLQVEIHFRPLFNEIQQHCSRTAVWAGLWCCSHFSQTCILLPHLTPFSPQHQTATVHSSGCILNLFKKYKVALTIMSPNFHLAQWQYALWEQSLRDGKWQGGFWVCIWRSHLYTMLWVLSLYGWKIIFSCHTVNIVTGIYFQHAYIKEHLFLQLSERSSEKTNF